MAAKGDAGRAGAFVDFDCVAAEAGYPYQWLGIEEEQYSGDPVGQGFAGACEQLLEPG